MHELGNNPGGHRWRLDSEIVTYLLAWVLRAQGLVYTHLFISSFSSASLLRAVVVLGVMDASLACRTALNWLDKRMDDDDISMWDLWRRRGNVDLPLTDNSWREVTELAR